MRSLHACGRGFFGGKSGLSLLSLFFVAIIAAGCGPTGEAGADGECGPGQFVCGSGECIDRALRCNGTDNCADGSDEDDCLDRCDGRTDYRCRDGKTCISTLQLCDGREDCPGGDDEATCGTRECDGFLCRDGTCLEASAKCNGTVECPGGEDESAETCAPARCPNEDDMRCRDGKTCVERAKVCDGVPHCPGGEDESDVLCKRGGDGDGDGGAEAAGKDEGDGNGRPGGGKPGGGGGGDTGPGPSGPQKPGEGRDPSTNRPCVSIDDKGICDGDVLVWCDHGKLERRNCAREGKSCGRTDLQSGHMCLDGPGAPPPQNECGDVTEEGRCDGTTLTFCSRGRVRVQNCGRQSRECRVEDGKARCLAPMESMGGQDGCGDLSEVGRCGQNDRLEWCEGGEVKHYDCAASGMTCQMNAGKHECVAKPCDGVTFQGSCSGDTLTYCATGDRLTVVDCQQTYGLSCGFQNSELGHNCMATGAQGPCGGVSFEGRCDGDTVSWCEDGLNQYDCSVVGKRCGQMPDSELYGCVASSNSCGNVTFYGACQGQTVVWCAAGALRSRDCAADGKACGLSDSTLGYWCVDSGSSNTANSCLGHCNKSGPVPGSSPACYCDDTCLANGDCCAGSLGYSAVCTQPTPPPASGPSCEGHCGEFTRAPGSDPACYCDAGCEVLGDCCQGAKGYEAICAAEQAGPSCSGHCGQTSPAPGSNPDQPCHCDSGCEAFNDCCPDYFGICT